MYLRTLLRRRVLFFIVLCAAVTAGASSGQNVSAGLIVPAYANPCCDGGPDMWSALIDAAIILGDDLYVILNPANGPGATLDPNYVNDFGSGPLTELQYTNSILIGYVATGYASRSLPDVHTEVDLYYDPDYWRATGIQIHGIFFDEVSNDLADVGYYETLRDHIVSVHDPDAIIVGNPGTSFVNNPSGQTTWTADDYAQMADILVTFEADAQTYRASYIPPVWLDSYPAERFAHIIHTQPGDTGMSSALSLALQRKAGWVYLTDDVLSNPYDMLPSYWTHEVDAALGLIFADGFEDGSTSAWTP